MLPATDNAVPPASAEPLPALPKSRSGIWLLLAAFLLAGGGGGYWYWKAHRKTGGAAVAEEPKPRGAVPGQIAVEAVAPQRGGIDRVCVQPGTLEPLETADLYSKVSGFLSEESVDIGSVVKKGDVLAKIFAPEYEKQVLRNRADVEHAKARVRQMEARITAAQAEAKAAPSQVALAELQLKSKAAYASFRRKQLERMTELSREKAIDGRVRDESEDNFQAAFSAEDAAREAITLAKLKIAVADANVLGARADLDEAEAQVAVSESELAKAQVMVDYTRIVADYDGVITRCNFRRSAFIRSADSGGDRVPLFTIERIDRIRVVVQVPDLDVPFVDVGDRARVQIDAFPDRVIESAVSKKASSEDLGTRTMRTEIEIPNADHKFERGMYGQVTILLEAAKADSLTVPSAVVEGRGKGARGVVRVVRDGKVHLLPVIVGADNGVRVEVVSGLDPKDRVIVRANGPIIEGTPVAVSGEAK